MNRTGPPAPVRSVFTIFGPLLILAACGGEPPESRSGVSAETSDGLREAAPETATVEHGASEGDSLRWTMELVERDTGPCDASEPEGSPPCATVDLRYPVFEPAPPAAASANDWITRRLTHSPDPDRRPADSPVEWAEGFLGEFREHQREFPDLAGGWFAERRIEVARNDRRIVGLQFTESMHTGGAHPLSIQLHAAFDAHTGEAIGSIHDHLAPGAAPELAARATRALRSARGLPTDTPLTDHGFWEETLPLPNSWLPSSEGLVLHYNVYEISPYAMGPTTLLIAWSDAAPLMREPDRWRP